MRRLLGRLGTVALLATAPVGVYVAGSHEAPSYPKAWDARVAPLASFVETERGLRFEHPVEVTFLDDAAFRRKVSVDDEPDARKKADRFGEELRALGLLRGDADVLSAVDDLNESDIVGFYSPEDETLFVRGTELTPYVRSTLVHELTHALQDQHFDLQALDRTDGDQAAVRSLVEGDAMRVEDAYQEHLSDAEQEEYDDEESALRDASSGRDAPAVLEELFSFPYLFGPAYLDALVALGGNDVVDEAFRHPPSADAQVLDPRAHPVRWRPRRLPAPTLPRGAKKVDDAEAFGQAWVAALVGTHVPWPQSWQVSQVWQGDTLQAYRSQGRTCVAVDVATSDRTAATGLAQALRGWAAALPGATASPEGDVVHLRSCDPGTTAEPRVAAPDTLSVLGARAQIIHEVMRGGGGGFRRSSCITDHVIAAVGPAVVVRESLDARTQERLRAAAAQADDVC